MIKMMMMTVMAVMIMRPDDFGILLMASLNLFTCTHIREPQCEPVPFFFFDRVRSSVFQRCLFF